MLGSFFAAPDPRPQISEYERWFYNFGQYRKWSFIFQPKVSRRGLDVYKVNSGFLCICVCFAFKVHDLIVSVEHTYKVQYAFAHMSEKSISHNFPLSPHAAD